MRIIRNALATATIVSAGLLAVAWPSDAARAEHHEANEKTSNESTQEPAEAMVSKEVAIISVKGMGDITVELLEEKAPKTVENFQKLAKDGFYDGTTFHRVIPGFMIQGGDPNSKNDDPQDDGRGGPGYTIKAEFNDTPHVRGVLSMARSRNPDSAGSQFFIVVAPSPHLDGQYTAFGRVIDGLDVVDQVVNAPRDQHGRVGPRDRPLQDVVMERVRITEIEVPAGS